MKKTKPYFILMTLVFLVYGNTLLNSFHFDDIPSILEKPWIRGLDKIPQFIFSFSHRPLVILSFNLNYAISEFRVWSYHIVNILAHVGVTFLVYQLARLIGATLGKGRDASCRQAPFLAALIFALHPLNTQSVTYISSRSSIFVTFFYLLALILFFRGLQARHPLAKQEDATSRVQVFHFAGTTAALTLGGLSKEIIITWPAMAFLFHYYVVSGISLRRWLTDNLKLILPVAGILLMGGIYILSGGKFLQASGVQYSSADYFLTQTFVVPFEYFWKMFFPFNLSIDIDFPTVTGWTQLANYGGIAVLLAFAAFFLTSRNPWIGFGMAWSLITVLPTSSFVPLLDLAVEHRTYLPLVGFSIFSSALLCQTLGFARSRLEANQKFSKIAYHLIPLAIVLIVVFFSVATIHRNTIWKDEVTLWSDAQKKSPRLVRPYNNVGEAYDKLRQYDEAIPQFEKALRLNPSYVFALNNLGNVYGKLERYDKAIEYFRKALAVQTDYTPAIYNLAKALHVGGESEEALKYYRQAVANNPYFEEAIFNLAHLESQLGLFRESVESYLQFIKMNPNHVKAYFGLANAYSGNHQPDQAIAAYQQTIRLNPGYLFPRINLAATYMQVGKVDEALTAYKEILKGQPNLAGVHKNLGLIYSRHKNDLERALYHFQQSLMLDEKQPQAVAIKNTIADLQRKILEAGKG